MGGSEKPVPAQVARLVDSLGDVPAALVGCRAAGAELPCCEYDIAVFAEGDGPQVITLDGERAELLYFGSRPAARTVDLYGMKIVRDNKTFSLASSAGDISREKFARAVSALGRKTMVSSLFCQSRARQHAGTVAGHMWAKAAAYHFVSGAIALSGSRPMPLHELQQARQVDVRGIADGLASALECIGLERATRPAIARSREALMELKSKDYDRDLVMSKLEYLLERQMLPDCYYYAGRVAADSLSKRNDRFFKSYAKLVQLALDLTSDAQQVEKLQRSMFSAANAALRG